MWIKTDANLMSGDIVKVRIDGAMEYDLIGSLCDQAWKNGGIYESAK